jgi:hypothetical protein
MDPGGRSGAEAALARSREEVPVQQLATTRGRALRALASCSLLLCFGLPAAAAGHLSIQGGAFAPWQGDVGFSTTIQLLGANRSGRSRWGGEFEYRNFDSKIAGVAHVGVESYVMRGMWQYHFRPDAAVTPYIGLGFGLSINSVNADKVDLGNGRDVRGSTGAGLDGLFLLGLQFALPGAEYVSLFGEGRVGLAFDATGENGDTDVIVENLGGASGSVGLRFRF